MTGRTGHNHRYSELKSYSSCSLAQRQGQASGDVAAAWASKEQITQTRSCTALYLGGRKAPGPDRSVHISSG